MTTLEEELRAALRTQAQALRVPERPELDRDIEEPHRRPSRRWLIAAACLALLVAGMAVAQRQADDPATVIATIPDTTAPAPVGNGWVALAGDPGGGDIYLARPGEDAHRLEVAGSDTASDACPAWSPDGTRLLLGRLTGSSDATPGDAELVIVPVSLDGAAGTPTVIALDGFATVAPSETHPCGTWASDGRWVALRGPGEVWVVDTRTGVIRRLPGLRPIDLEWRPGTDELAIAGDVRSTPGAEGRSAPVTIYSVSTGERRHLGSVRAAQITWSPDGSTLAYTGVYEPPDEGDPDGLWLVDADGTNKRVLVADNGRAVHGIGPVWSPTGDRIVYQRLCCGAEKHEVVLVTVADGTETVIEPPQAEGSDEVRWYPFDVTWSPDGTTLLYSAWRSRVYPSQGPVDGRGQVIVVPVDTPNDVTVLAPGFNANHEWFEVWGSQPG